MKFFKSIFTVLFFLTNILGLGGNTSQSTINKQAKSVATTTILNDGIRVLFPVMEGAESYFAMDDNGNTSGFYGDLLKIISRYTSLNFVPIIPESTSEIISILNSISN